MTDPQTMPAGRELDAAVGERLFNRSWPAYIPLEYSTDLSAAFSLIPPDTYFSLTYHAGKWVAQIGTAKAIAEGDTAAVAICRAALKRAEEQTK